MVNHLSVNMRAPLDRIMDTKHIGICSKFSRWFYIKTRQVASWPILFCLTSNKNDSRSYHSPSIISMSNFFSKSTSSIFRSNMQRVLSLLPSLDSKLQQILDHLCSSQICLVVRGEDQCIEGLLLIDFST